MLNVSVFVARNEHRKIWNCLFDEEEFFFFLVKSVSYDMIFYHFHFFDLFELWLDGNWGSKGKL